MVNTYPEGLKPVCPFSPRPCNVNCRAYIAKTEKCNVLELLEDFYALIASRD